MFYLPSDRTDRLPSICVIRQRLWIFLSVTKRPQKRFAAKTSHSSLTVSAYQTNRISFQMVANQSRIAG